MSDENEVLMALTELLNGTGSPSLEWETKKEFIFTNLKKLFGIYELEKEQSLTFNNFSKRLTELEQKLTNLKLSVDDNNTWIVDNDNIKEKIDGMSNGCSLAQQNLSELTELKDAGSARQTGNTEVHMEIIENIRSLREALGG